MPTEAWRLAVARWGDPVWTLAVLMTGRHEAAQAAVVDAFCTTYRGGAPDDPEHALYQALLRQHSRLDGLRRRPLLTPALRRLAPSDRLTLALWLLRDQNGQQLASLTGETVEALTTRLTTAIMTWARAKQVPGPALSQPELARFVNEQLALPPAGSVSARAGIYPTQLTLLDQVRSELQELTYAMHLPPGCPARIEGCLQEQQQAGELQWWQRKTVWQVGLVVLTITLLGLLLIPRSNITPQTTTSTPTAQSLVQEALQHWPATADHIRHRRVWAIDPRHQNIGPVVTDIWLGAGDSAEHRVEVRRGKKLLEWQIADGTRRLNYGTLLSVSSCPWILSRPGNAQVARSFRLSPEDQRAVRDARLQQGAYGLGYLALQRALAAPDLRSYGIRVVASQTFTTLIYSDPYWGPSQQVVLRIEPTSGELYGVQTVSISGTQTRARDLWRMDVNEDVEFIPSPLPEWNKANGITRLIDPTCLTLTLNDVQDLRTTLNPSGTKWYLPPTLPAGTDRAAIIALTSSPNTNTRVPTSVQFSGPGRFLALSPISWQPNIAAPSDIERGKWRIAIEPHNGNAPTHMTLHLRPDHHAGVFPQYNEDATGWSLEQTIDSFVATIDVTAQGWTDDELLAVVDQLQPPSLIGWVGMRDHFVAQQPLDDTARTRIDQAIAALKPPAQGTILTSAQTKLRSREPLPELPDPYHLVNELWAPEATQLKQTLVYGDSGLERFTEQRTTLNGVPYVSRSSDGKQFIFDNHAQGWAVEGDAAQLGTPAYPEQPGTEMLATILGGSTPITITEQAGAWLLERSTPVTQEELYNNSDDLWNDRPWTANLPTGSLTYRLWLDRVTSLPQRFEVVHSAADEKAKLLETVIIERRVVDGTGTATDLKMPSVPADDLRFQWVPGTGPVISQANAGSSNVPTLVWNDENDIALQWQLDPGPESVQLSMGAFKAPRWFNLSRLPTVHRALYRVGIDNSMGVMVTQGSKDLMTHILRYSEMSRGADAMPWTSSTALTVNINGTDHAAWLLAHNEVAVLVIELDDRMVHIMGLRSYLEGPLIPLLSHLTATP